jgi:hypothetical protein
MYGIQGFLTFQSKLIKNYKHLCQAVRYQIHALIKAEYNQPEITKVLEQHKSSISRELARNRGAKGYLTKQACEFVARRSERSRKTPTVETWVRDDSPSFTTSFGEALEVYPYEVPDVRALAWLQVLVSMPLWRTILR